MEDKIAGEGDTGDERGEPTVTSCMRAVAVQTGEGLVEVQEVKMQF